MDSRSYLVVRLPPSALVSDSIVIAWAGQIASQSLQAIHLSSPVAYLLNACSPLNRGDSGPFSNGYMMVLQEGVAKVRGRSERMEMRALDMAGEQQRVGRDGAESLQRRTEEVLEADSKQE